MFFGSAIGSIPDTASPRGTFLRDLAASVAALGALGALLVVIQLHSGPGAAAKPPRVQAPPQASAEPVAKQPRDLAATPDADEERIARAMVAFALSKVSPLQPDPIASIPALPVPAFTPKKAVKTPAAAPRASSPRFATNLDKNGFRQAEWPARASVLRYSSLTKDEPSRFSLTRLEIGRYVPGTQSVVNGAQSLATGTKKAVGASVAGLRNGVSAVQEHAIAITARIW